MINLNSSDSRLLKVHNVHVKFRATKGRFFIKRPCDIHIVKGINLSISAGEIFGLVGESGCGKTTLAKAIVGLAPISTGNLFWKGQTMDMKRIPRERKIQMVFQDPHASLNPRLTIYEMLSEVISLGDKLSKQAIIKHIHELLDCVSLDTHALNKYPHEFSGGQRQRIALARALAAKPELIIADEPVSALDVSVQAQILNLLKSLVKEFGLALFLIGHDLSVMHYLTDRIAVMYAGEIVEQAPTPLLFQDPRHSYTQALLNAIPIADPHRAKLYRCKQLGKANDMSF